MPKKKFKEKTYDQPKNVNPIPPKPPMPEETEADKKFNSRLELLEALKPEKDESGKYRYGEKTKEKIEAWHSKYGADFPEIKQEHLTVFAFYREMEYNARAEGKLLDNKIILDKMKKYSAKFFGDGGFSKIELDNLSPEVQDIIRVHVSRAEDKYHINQTLKELAEKGRVGYGIIGPPALVSEVGDGNMRTNDTGKITIYVPKNTLPSFSKGKSGLHLPVRSDIFLQGVGIDHELLGHQFHNAAAWAFCEKTHKNHQNLEPDERKKAYEVDKQYLLDKTRDKSKAYANAWREDDEPASKNIQRATTSAEKAVGYSGYSEKALGEWFAEVRSHAENVPPAQWNNMEYAVYKLTEGGPEKLTNFVHQEYLQDKECGKYDDYIKAGYYKSSLKKRPSAAILLGIDHYGFIEKCRSKGLDPEVVKDLSNAVKLKVLTMVRSTDVAVVNRKKEDLKRTLKHIEKMEGKDLNNLYIKHKKKVDNNGLGRTSDKRLEKNPMVFQSKGTLAWRNALNEVKRKVQEEQKRKPFSLSKLKTEAHPQSGTNRTVTKPTQPGNQEYRLKK